MFNDSMKNSFTVTFDSWTTDRRTVNTGSDYQLDIGSDNNSTKYLIAAHQTEAGRGVPNKANNIAVFDHLNV